MNRLFWFLLAIFLSCQPALLAQHGGGGHGGEASRTTICLHDCTAPSQGNGSNTDDLKDFHRVLAVQATSQQSAEFANIVKNTEAAGQQLQKLHELLQIPSAAEALSLCVTNLDQAVEKAHAGNQNFLATFTEAQKSGLAEITKKLLSADADLSKGMKTLDQVVQENKSAGEKISGSAATVDKTLSSFQTEQLALGDEMSIALPSSGQEVTFNLSLTKNSFDVAGQPVSLSTAGSVFRTSVVNGENIFTFDFNTDVSDLQRNVRDILQSELNRAPACGERIKVTDATLVPDPPASLVTARIHFERWFCPPGGGDSSTELMADDGTLEVKLIPAIGQNFALSMASKVVRADADGTLREDLLHGSLGETLRQKITALLLTALQKGTDINSILPGDAKTRAVLQKVEFQGSGAGLLSLALTGQMQFSDEQTKQFASDFKQRLSTQAVPP